MGYEEMSRRIGRGEPTTLNDVMASWQAERNEVFERMSQKVRFLYGKIFDLQDELNKKEKLPKK